MFVGHIGAGLAIGRFERRVNVGIFVCAALLLDLILWLFVLVGWESVVIPADFASTHQVKFAFPYSHSLVFTVLWSLVAAVGAWAYYARLHSGRLCVALMVAAAVASHWLLDALVHRPELPLVGSNSQVVGFGLWDNMPLALMVEGALTVVGVVLYVPGSALKRGKSLALVLLCLAVLAFTVAGMTVAPPAPTAPAMAASSVVTLLVLCALVVWLGKRQTQ